MNKNYLWTKSKARLQRIRTCKDKAYHWLFLPGGPGLGSESLAGLTHLLDLPGTIWHLDLPGDGSNVTADDFQSFSYWSEALVEAVGALDKVILVAHSTGGMYALATPQLEKMLIGLVLMDSAPDASWQAKFMEYVNQHPLPELTALQTVYVQNPNNEILKQMTVAAASYVFTAQGLEQGTKLLQSLPYNFRSNEWSAQHFDETYQAKWIPTHIPTLLFAGDQDHITPLQLFKEAPKFQRENIYMQEIKDAGHFPWIEAPQQVAAIFAEYCRHYD